MNAISKRSKIAAVAPDDVEPKKPKVLVYGKAGVGKTFGALDFPSVFYIDTEGGADLSHYRAKLKAAGGVYLGPDQGSLDFERVIEQVQALATEQHPYKTIVFDSITRLFNLAISEESERLGERDAFGASKKPAVRQMTRLVRWVNKCDMSAIFVAHEKTLYVPDGKGGTTSAGFTFDGWDKLEYELHLTLRIDRMGTVDSARRVARIGKSRLTGFPEGTHFDWSYDEFAQRWGRDVIERTSTPVEVSTPDQVAQVIKLLQRADVAPDWTAKALKKANVESWDEMDSTKITSVIKYLESRQ